MKTVLILGATGQVGQALLQLVLQHPEIARVIAPTRRPLAPHAKLVNPLARALLEAGLHAPSGLHVIESEQLQG